MIDFFNKFWQFKTPIFLLLFEWKIFIIIEYIEFDEQVYKRVLTFTI